jgi:hypothetical protein
MAKRSTKFTRELIVPDGGAFKAPPVSDEARKAFDALTSGDTRFESPGENRYKGFALMAVLHDGDPTAAIVYIDPPKLGSDSNKFLVTPVFIYATPGILEKLRDPLFGKGLEKGLDR